MYNEESSEEKVCGISRNPDKESHLASNSWSGPTSFKRKMGSPLTVHFKLNRMSLTALVFFGRGWWLLKMEETRKLSPKPCKSKEPVKTEWGAQSVVFTYFQGDINSVVDEHFSRALSNAKNPQDLSTKHRDETVVLKNGELLSMPECGVRGIGFH